MGHASERHSIGGERMENQKEDSNISMVWKLFGSMETEKRWRRM